MYTKVKAGACYPGMDEVRRFPFLTKSAQCVVSQKFWHEEIIKIRLA